LHRKTTALKCSVRAKVRP